MQGLIRKQEVLGWVDIVLQELRLLRSYKTTNQDISGTLQKELYAFKYKTPQRRWKDWVFYLTLPRTEKQR